MKQLSTTKTSPSKNLVLRKALVDGYMTEIDNKQFKKYLLLSELVKLPDPPKTIFAMGNLALLNQRSITIIGTRKPSEYGTQVILDIVPPLASAGISVVSDLEQGCNKIAQQTALSHNGSIIAVLSSSLAYFKRHKLLKLINQALEQNKGLLLSEYGKNYAPSTWKFAQRNRLIAALGQKLLVIEAGTKSGTLHTCSVAKKLNHPVFAIPGNIYSNNSIGTNNLLKNGAVPITTSLDILSNYGKTSVSSSHKSLKPSPTQIKLLKYLDNDISTNKLARTSGIPLYKLLPLLTTMELSGLVKKLGDNWVRT